MANDVELFKGGKLPSYLQGDEPSAATKSLIGSGSTLRRISIRGSVFRMMLGSEEISKSDERSMNFIIVAAAPAFARTYYEGAYVEGENKSPDCWSDDGVAPSPHVENPQCGTCAKCPQNIKGSGTDNSRACRYSARIAVMLEGDDNYEIYGMTIPATSLFGTVEREGFDPMQRYAQKLAQHRYDVNKVVTEFRFDTEASTPKLMFRAIRPVSEEEWDVIQDFEGDEEVERHIGPREFRDNDEEEAEETGGDEPLFAEDEEEEEKPKPKPKAKTRKPKPKPKPAPAEDDEVEEEEEEEKPKPKPKAKTRKPKPKPKPAPAEDDEVEEEEEPVKRPSKKDKQPKPVDDEDDLDALLDEWASEDEDEEWGDDDD